MILHNYRNEKVTIPQNTQIGALSIKSFSEKSVFIPQRVDQTKFDSMKTHFKMAIFFELREDLSNKIHKMLEKGITFVEEK